MLEFFPMKRKEKSMKTSFVLAAIISAALAFSVAAQAKEPIAGEMVQMRSLPTSVQQTLKEKAAGGEIVRVKREDDSNGKWYYEATVKTNGKEWRLEIDPNGKFVEKR
jgi:uncharacterized membrane protein YkoI